MILKIIGIASSIKIFFKLLNAGEKLKYLAIVLGFIDIYLLLKH
jgi:hypothetical protein